MLTELPKVGEKVRYLGGEKYDHVVGLKVGEIYEVTREGFDAGRYMVFKGGRLSDEEWFIYGNEHPAGGDLHKYELAEDAPSTSDLIANLARRVSELEACLAVEQAHREDLTEQNAQQAYEINELYRAFVRKEAQV